eukprot:scpid106034/ scgid10409/ 
MVWRKNRKQGLKFGRAARSHFERSEISYGDLNFDMSRRRLSAAEALPLVCLDADSDQEPFDGDYDSDEWFPGEREADAADAVAAEVEIRPADDDNSPPAAVFGFRWRGRYRRPWERGR